MPTTEKAQTVERAREWYSRSKGIVFTEYRGLKVHEMQTLRANLRKKGGDIHVIKNTLLRLAGGNDIFALPDELHNGPTAVAFLYDNESECVKVLFDYGKTNKNLVVKGGMLAGRALSAGQVEALSQLPSREILIAQVIGAIAAPLTQLVGVIEALYADPIRTIGAVADKAAESVGPAEKKTEPQPASIPEEPSAQMEPTSDADVPAAPEALEAQDVTETPETPAEAPAEAGSDVSPEQP